ncbi:MAG: hypothetical protein IKS54_07370 [Erysipelotrichaceae bacterium]|nr:hypothetical protein [Erysipelotrichaceae bacterium]
MNRKQIRLYNIIFPLWLLIWIPSPLWVILIPLNYLIDRFVLKKSLPKDIDQNAFVKKHCPKICIAGFVSDFIGSGFLFAVDLLLGENYELANAICYSPFRRLDGFAIVLSAIVLSGICIYLLDKWILSKTELDREAVKRSSLMMALFTAPYLFLLPMEWFW